MSDWNLDPAETGQDRQQPLSIDRLAFRLPCGRSCTLHRFAGRWLVVRVVPSIEPEHRAPALSDDLEVDAVEITIVDGQVVPTANDPGNSGTIAFDPERCLARHLPSLAPPYSVILDPLGRLVAIVPAEHVATLLGELAGAASLHTTNGSIDRGDMHT